jgi:hypothetical protein
VGDHAEQGRPDGKSMKVREAYKPENSLTGDYQTASVLISPSHKGQQTCIRADKVGFGQWSHSLAHTTAVIGLIDQIEQADDLFMLNYRYVVKIFPVAGRDSLYVFIRPAGSKLAARCRDQANGESFFKGGYSGCGI